MIERREDSRFAFEAGQPIRIEHEHRRQDLDGDVAPEPRVVGAVHLAHAPLPRRPPIYTGLTLAAAGTAVMRGTAASWLGAAMMTLGWYVKGRLEERFLRQELGAEAYDAYARRVPMLVPFLTFRPRR